MKRRATQAAFLVGMSACGYLIKVAGDHAPDWLVEMGSSYDCRSDEIDNGVSCQKKHVLAYSPPCPQGWRQDNETCVWTGRN